MSNPASATARQFSISEPVSYTARQVSPQVYENSDRDKKINKIAEKITNSWAKPFDDFYSTHKITALGLSIIFVIPLLFYGMAKLHDHMSGLSVDDKAVLSEQKSFIFNRFRHANSLQAFTIKGKRSVLEQAEEAQKDQDIAARRDPTFKAREDQAIKAREVRAINGRKMSGSKSITTRSRESMLSLSPGLRQAAIASDSAWPLLDAEPSKDLHSYINDEIQKLYDDLVKKCNGNEARALQLMDMIYKGILNTEFKAMCSELGLNPVSPHLRIEIDFENEQVEFVMSCQLHNASDETCFFGKVKQTMNFSDPSFNTTIELRPANDQEDSAFQLTKSAMYKWFDKKNAIQATLDAVL